MKTKIGYVKEGESPWVVIEGVPAEARQYRTTKYWVTSAGDVFDITKRAAAKRKKYVTIPYLMIGAYRLDHMVAELFVGTGCELRQPGVSVYHKDGDALNNKASNLGYKARRPYVKKGKASEEA